MTEISVRALADQDDRSGFASGDEELDRFFHQFAGQNQFRHHIGVTYVATDGSSILGFVTVSASSIEIEKLPSKALKKLPAYPLPILRIARMASATKARGQGIGALLLRSAFQLAWSMAHEYGCVGVVVDAKEGAVAFYERYGFEVTGALEGESNERPMPRLMFLPLGSIPKGSD